MNNTKYFLLKNKELTFYLLCFFSHLFFAPFYKYYGFEFLFLYNILMALIYGIFIFLFNKIRKRFFILFSYVEVMIYILLVTILTGTDFGTRLYGICIIPSLFFFVNSTKASQKSHAILSGIAVVFMIFVIWYEFIRPRAIFQGFMSAVTVYKSFYRIHVIFSTTISVVVLFYLSIVTQYNLERSEKKAKNRVEKLDFMANHDQLTGLINRRSSQWGIANLEENKRINGNDYAICVFDIDDFKKTNDTFGHKAGDFVLIHITKLISSLLNPGTQFARWGGEEFLLIFPEANEETLRKLEQIRKTVVNEKLKWNGKEIKITLTFGISSSKTGKSSDKILIDADNCLFKGKKEGKNRICVSEDF